MPDFFEESWLLSRELSAKDKLIDELIKELEEIGKSDVRVSAFYVVKKLNQIKEWEDPDTGY